MTRRIKRKPPNHTFQPDNLVRLSMAKNKKKFDGFKARLISVGNKLVQINFEQGPCNGV